MSKEAIMAEARIWTLEAFVCERRIDANEIGAHSRASPWVMAALLAPSAIACAGNCENVTTRPMLSSVIVSLGAIRKLK